MEFWIDGSFVESVDHPQDIDAYFTLRDPREWLTLPDLGRPSGIFDRDGNSMTFAEAFRQQRSTFRRKGIIRLRRRNDQI